MARRSKKNDGSGALALLLAIPIAIFNFFKENVWLAILLGIVIVAVILGIIIAKKKKREAYLRWYYDRNRRIAELNANSHMDTALTQSILEAAANGTTVAIGKSSPELNEVKEAYKKVLQSSDVLKADNTLSAQNYGRALTATNGISAKIEPMILRYTGENDGGYVFYVFPETVLAFVEGPEQVVFLAAYYPSALSLSCAGFRYTLNPLVIPDRTQNPIRYYDRYCPIKDAIILSSRWDKVNNSGNRNLRYNIENNPLHFTLKYGELTAKFGTYSLSNNFSRFEAVAALAQAYDKFKAGKPFAELKKETVQAKPTPVKDERKELVERMTNAINQKAQNNVFTSVTTQQEAAKKEAPVASVFTTTDTSLQESEPKNALVAETSKPADEAKPKAKSVPATSVVKRPISIDDARYRNRMIANRIVQELNQTYSGKYDFKVYQVRKPRSDWAMQDAGIYTYIKDTAGNEYTVELNIRTDVEDIKTELEFYVWSKQADYVKTRYSALIAKYAMKMKSTGYHIIKPVDYENESQITMENALRNDVTVLFAELVEQ